MSLQEFLDTAITAGVAPGLVAVAFNKEGAFATAAAGVSNLDSKALMKEDSVVWAASMSKAACSVVCLALAEKNSISLDSHEALASIVPELANTPGNPLWTLFDGKDSDGKYKFKQATVGVTLRHLLTHTSGLSYDFNSAPGKWISDPEGGGYESLFSANISALLVPRLFESGTRFQYGCSTDFVGLFITRISKLSGRQAYQDILLTPLGITSDLDQFRNPSMEERKVQMAFQVGEGQFIPLPTPFDTAQFEGEPPEGKIPLYSGIFWGTIPAYAIFARALLNQTKLPNGTSILSPEMWKEATRDQLASMNIPSNILFAESHNPHLICEIHKWSQAVDLKSDNNVGWNLLQTVSVIEPTSSGLSTGSFNWAGLANSYYFVDPTNGCGGVISAQFFPWGTKGMLDLRTDFESWVIQSVATK